MTVSASLSPTPLLANETNQRNSLYLKINYRIPSFRLNIKSRYYSVTALPLEIKETSGWWRRHSSLPHLISTIRSHPTTAKTSWIDFHRLLRVRRRYQRRNDPPPPPPRKTIFIAGWWRRHFSLPHSISPESITPNHR